MLMESGSGAAKPFRNAAEYGRPDDCNITATEHELAESLGRAVDARDRRLARHSDVTADIASLLAQAQGLPPRASAIVHLAGHLHDVGKIGIPDSILRKPGPLTAEEWTVMRTHPAMGAEILRPVRAFCGRGGVCEIVLAHHERFDGSGYPCGLRGTAIPLGARLVAVADALSAMTEVRPYRGALPVETALAEIAHGAGRDFDPAVVRLVLGLRGAIAALLAEAARPVGNAVPGPLPLGRLTGKIRRGI